MVACHCGAKLYGKRVGGHLHVPDLAGPEATRKVNCCAAREHLRQLTVERVRDMVKATPPNPEGKVAPAESSAEPSDLCLECDETQPIQLSEDLRDIRTTGVNFILHSGGNSS